MRIKTIKPEQGFEEIHLKLENENLVIKGDGIEVLINTVGKMRGNNLSIFPRTEGLKTKIVFEEEDWAHPKNKPLELEKIEGIQFFREK